MEQEAYSSETVLRDFCPKVLSIDMDTTGTWPYGRRLEDQVATRFLSLFLDMSPDANGGYRYRDIERSSFMGRRSDRTQDTA